MLIQFKALWELVSRELLGVKHTCPTRNIMAKSKKHSVMKKPLYHDGWRELVRWEHSTAAVSVSKESCPVFSIHKPVLHRSHIGFTKMTEVKGVKKQQCPRVGGC
jgi:hypothetical protein